MKTNYLRGKVDIKANGEIITVIASDETLDRHGEILPIENWDLSKFKIAPRMLVDHDHTVSSIVGKWDNVRIEGRRLIMDAVFHDITELAREVKEMVKQKFLDTVSVGFIFNEDEDGTGDKAKRERFELIETSWVTVPANPSARVISSLKSAGVSEEEKEKLETYAKDIEESDEVLPYSEDEQPLPEDEEDTPTTEPEDDTEDKLVSSKEDFEEWQFINREKDTQFVLCDKLFLSKLLERSEQLETLTQDGKAKEIADKNARLARVALKEAAGYISHTLRELNKIED